MCTNTQICLRRRPVVVVGLAAGGLLLAGGSTDGRSGLLGDADRGLFGCCCCCCRPARRLAAAAAASERTLVGDDGRPCLSVGRAGWSTCSLRSGRTRWQLVLRRRAELSEVGSGSRDRRAEDARVRRPCGSVAVDDASDLECPRRETAPTKPVTSRAAEAPTA